MTAKTRSLPFSYKVFLMLSTKRFWFGLLGIGAAWLLSLVFSTDFKWDEAYALHTQPVETQGVLIAIDDTGASQSDEYIYKYTFKYSPNKNEETSSMQGFSYSPWQEIKEGDSVAVLYAQSSTGVAVIKGQSLGIFGGIKSVLVLYLTLYSIPFALVFSGIKKGFNLIHILQCGDLVKGVLVKTERGNITVNDVPQSILFFEFSDTNGDTKTISIKTFEPDQYSIKKKEWLVYKPGKEDQAIALNTLGESLSSCILESQS
ncbi:hypothetical protein V6R21_26600 [Limibacter armeniacum]|uniref:hypothetical protein n=1 Tax=Limibacter armeniacum TaxID=466084 RepID=UPI002FE6ACA5